MFKKLLKPTLENLELPSQRNKEMEKISLMKEPVDGNN